MQEEEVPVGDEIKAKLEHLGKLLAEIATRYGRVEFRRQIHAGIKACLELDMEPPELALAMLLVLDAFDEVGDRLEAITTVMGGLNRADH